MSKKYVFIGNRRFVLDEMIKQNLHIVMAYIVPNSYLASEIKDMDIPFQLITSKKNLIDSLENSDFDILICNGSPHILPVENMKKRLYVNIHPSYLPDLKGRDPVIGAMLFNRDSGATCHIMATEIDGGEVIAQTKIPFTHDLDTMLLYHLTFNAEKEVFVKALKKGFKGTTVQKKSSSDIYYSFDNAELLINFQDEIECIENKIKTYNTKKYSCHFIYNDEIIGVRNFKILNNPYITEYAKNYKSHQVIMRYDDVLLLKINDRVCKISELEGNHTIISIGSFLS